jgi:hypothetical protein
MAALPSETGPRRPGNAVIKSDKAADRKSRGFITMLLGWYPNAYSFAAGVTLFLTLVPAAICCPGHRLMELSRCRQGGMMEARGSGAVRFYPSG